MDAKTKVRALFGTWNNPVVQDWDQLVALLKPKYLIGQLEQGASGTLHWQFAVQWANSRSFAAVKKDLPLAHLEQVKSWQAAIKYCTKEDTRHSGPWEHGDRPTGSSGQGQAEDWEHWFELAVEGRFNEIPAKIQIKHLGNLEKIHRRNIKFIDQTDCRGIWIHGKPGMGKSHFAREVLGASGYYPKLNNKWWDGYQSQAIVIMEDVDKETIKFLHHHLKIWADKWGFIGETKGGAVAPSHRWLVVTSNYSLPALLGDLDDSELKQALLRRFTQFEMVDRNTLKDWNTGVSIDAQDVAAIFKI